MRSCHLSKVGEAHSSQKKSHTLSPEVRRELGVLSDPREDLVAGVWRGVNQVRSQSGRPFTGHT